MGNIFAGQDPANYVYRTRSVRLASHVTSIRLEAQFWAILDEIAQDQGMTTPRFLNRLYENAVDTHGTVSNFASLLRNACVIYLRQRQAALEAAPREAAAADVA